MDNQHRKISGYRELSQKEIDLMNKIKALGPLLEEVVLAVQEHINKQVNAAPLESDEYQRLNDATPFRFTALAKTEFQTGLMYLTRAVAQPTFF